MTHLDFIPIWAFTITIVILSMMVVECGFRIGRHRKSVGSNEPQSQIGTMIASTLALQAFLLGFTFSIAAGRFDERRTAVLKEANAIGTTYLRSDFLEDSSRVRVKTLLREYVKARLGFMSDHDVDTAIANSEALQSQLWLEAVSIAKSHQNSPICALFISSLNEVIDLHAIRVTAGLHARVPLIVWVCLLGVGSLSMLGVGYACGLAGHRSIIETTILVVSFGLVLCLVADLDRPMQGLIKTPQQPLQTLNKQIQTGAL